MYTPDEIETILRVNEFTDRKIAHAKFVSTLLEVGLFFMIAVIFVAAIIGVAIYFSVGGY